VNRLIDAQIDARNPRTAGRELPRGALVSWQVVLFSAASLALFLVAVYQLAPIVGWLWPIPVIGFVLYPYLKRATWLCHFWLGAVDGLAPIGAWAAIDNSMPWPIWLVGGAVAFWIAGFDLLYALFDLEVDRAQGLHSFPARFGVAATFRASRLCHVATVALLAGAGLGMPVGVFYWIAVGFVAAMLAYEQSLVSPSDWRRLDTAFFTMNGLISVGFFALVVVDVVR
jgi:4-hydroxybenzoate polyprenyltransferase